MSEVLAKPAALGRIGRYTIFEEMAEGGMARVFLAQKDGSPRLCVVKQLHGELEKHGTAGIRFQREAHLVSQLDHPNIARVIDAGLEDGKFCIAMELIDGVTLRQIIDEMDARKQIIPPAITLAIATQALDGLTYAHSLRGDDGRHLEIVHRDLSPKNVMLSYDGTVKIIDFGVARGRIDSFRTAPGMMVGTLHYMSPEQAMTETIDRRSDVYTFSVVLWEMLSGRSAVRDGKAVEVLEQVIGEMPPPLRSIDPGLPPAICAIIERGLNKDPVDRWQSAAAYREALRQATHPIDTVTPFQIGRFVSDLLPPERHPIRKWAEHLRALPIQDVPTLGDDQLKAADISALVATYVPDASESSSLTLPDAKAPISKSHSDDQITRPDTPQPGGASMALLLELRLDNDRLKRKVVALRRASWFLISVVLGLGLLVMYLLD